MKTINTESHKFKVRLSSLMFNYFGVFVFCVAAIFLIIFVVPDPAQGQEGRWFAGLWALFVLAFALPNALRAPYTIVLVESRELVFKSFISKRVFEVKDLKSIKASFLSSYFLDFKFKKGKVTVINSVDDLSQLIWLVKGINPNIQTRGC
jgi:hypothetical protein